MKSESLFCSIDKQAFSPSEKLSHCPSGHYLDLEFTPTLNPDFIARQPFDLWRYRQALPIPEHIKPISLGEPVSPIVSIDFSGVPLQVKQEQLFSSGSYKDRGSCVLMSKAKSLGITEVIQDSSGNAGASIAAYAARAGIKCRIFLPEQTSEAKLKQITAYGAEIIKIKGDRTATANAALQEASGTYYASHVFNPYFLHGTKTFAYEICEQMSWKVPDSLVLPAGNGTLLLGAYIGFQELMQVGITDRMPKLIAVQAENCAPLFHIWKKKTTSPVFSQTIAEGIAIPYPLRLSQMLHAIEYTNGEVITVTEDEISDTWKKCAQMGFYIEPTSAATIAGALAFRRNNSSEVYTLFSGSGLKK